MGKGFHYLQNVQNADGGWGYYAGKMSFSEPTCFAILALGDSELYKINIQKGLAWLTNQQLKDGGWKVSSNDDEASWVTSLAVIVLTMLGDTDKQVCPCHKTTRDLGASWLLKTHGHLLSGKKGLRLNTKARGWPWLEGNSSWVEPTAYALIALKIAMSQHNESPPLIKRDFSEISRRIQDAEGLLFDTMCEEGGWNYGNNCVLGVNLKPYLSTTALTLVALQGCEGNKEAHKAIQQSLNYIKAFVNLEMSVLSIAWSIICLDIYGEETASLCTSLYSLQKDNGSWEDNAYLTALSLLALKTKEGSNPFKIKERKPGPYNLVFTKP